MGFTTPRTWVALEIDTAANMNTHVRDNFKAVAGVDKAACRVYHSTTQSHVTSGTPQIVIFDTERFDTQTMHSTVSNTGRITIPSGWGGIYLIGANIRFAVNGTGIRSIDILVNGATGLGFVSATPSSTNECDLQVTTLYKLVAGDYVEVQANQTSTASLNMTSVAANFPEFWAIWMGTG